MNRKYLQQKFGIDWYEYNARGFTLIELLVVMAIVAFMTVLILNAVTKFKQVILVTNTAKEIVVYLREARRDAINNVVTSTNETPLGYYIYFDGTEKYYWGECAVSICHAPNLIKSGQYGNVDVSPCTRLGVTYFVVKFNHVTGEMVLTNDPYTSTPSSDYCDIEVSISTSLISSTKKIRVHAGERTIKML
ncbi:MAG: prepilin-type N-terminal cleavage/methylation domain-containing protein [Patescibacteria group bacterium]